MSSPAPLYITPTHSNYSVNQNLSQNQNVNQSINQSLSIPSSPRSPLSDIPDSQQSTMTSSLPIEYPAGMRPLNVRARRGSVSAESDRRQTPSNSINHDASIFVPKTAEQISRIRSATRQSILFSGLDRDQQQQIIDSMSEFPVTPGQQVITQGENGDYFYVIDSGIFDVYRDGVKVFEYVEKGSFGELALMYNCPRAASVTARTSGCLWRTDRATFQHLVIASTAQKRKLLEQALEAVPILSNLSKQERAMVADVLETHTFHRDECVIRQGEMGESMYFVMQGEAKAMQSFTEHVNGCTTQQEIEVGRIRAGEYFGERSLLTFEPRAATVIAVSDELQVAVMDRSAFERLLGSVKDIMHRQIGRYRKAAEIHSEKGSPRDHLAIQQAINQSINQSDKMQTPSTNAQSHVQNA